MPESPRTNQIGDDREVITWGLAPAAQQPTWAGPLLAKSRDLLSAAGWLVTPSEVNELRAALADVAEGRGQVLQAGDCAEDPSECVPELVERKAHLLDALATRMGADSGRPVVRVGRLAGQFAKPRSRPTERHGDQELPVFRGHMINDPRPDADLRQADPLRLVECYRAASTATRYLRHRAARGDRVWTSHEALVLDYELPLLRPIHEDKHLLTSTHWPWIGDRTRQLDGAHVQLLAAVVNPVACKVGPTMTANDLVALCEKLDPGREPGRLTLIARLGADSVAQRLPGLVRAVRRAGFPVIWLCDPMHANITTTGNGHKTRRLDQVVTETWRFRAAVDAEGGTPGGLHLEITPDDVLECVRTDAEFDQLRTPGAPPYLTHCDPRLNPSQANEVVREWRAARTGVALAMRTP
ncbi:3-deoxy-7-phosphoheptulonate synthase [Actinokineospora sp. HBU206404]|uniref:Phospho-2-dehydro-3-deoxyheptonate aldolase n=1 Tax=Actinokineospora xionganensis TaxID=2684470 RepID=A0ABR7L022_9PSEU|nr:3-deoxy-7-phosphoheptulonate synthase [Actinokineospora xionganensis]